MGSIRTGSLECGLWNVTCTIHSFVRSLVAIAILHHTQTCATVETHAIQIQIQIRTQVDSNDSLRFGHDSSINFIDFLSSHALFPGVVSDFGQSHDVVLRVTSNAPFWQLALPIAISIARIGGKWHIWFHYKRTARIIISIAIVAFAVV